MGIGVAEVGDGGCAGVVRGGIGDRHVGLCDGDVFLDILVSV